MASTLNKENAVYEIRTIADFESSPQFEERPVLARHELVLKKWRLIHKYFHAHPFPMNTRLKRSEQWRDTLQYVRDIGDLEVLDWVLLQAEVAGNIERGIREMRPRKGGPCHALLLEYVRDRKRKALAVYKWARAADEDDTATNETLTPAILARHSTEGTGGTENL
ncbi:MAG: hypothetical protein JKY68_08880 [Rhodospirillales bacterium]|nr:hypothetical protein [Rhodospirillales bacterium]